MISTLRKIIRSTPILKNGVYDPLRYLQFLIFNFSHRKYYVADDDWEKRINNVLNSEDNKEIPRVADAGKLINGNMIMHNGLKIKPMSYYGAPVMKMLELNKGVHEPQEERVFAEVLKNLPPEAVMLELGCYWSFYSMWFKTVVPNAKCYMVEPESLNLEYGKSNFKINNLEGIFFQGFIGSNDDFSTENIKTYTVDGLLRDNNIDFLHIMHSDIQGAEYDMLEGAQKSIANKKIGYIFISTHSNKLHNRCEEFLIKNDFEIITSVNLFESYSLDGLLVARSKSYPGLGPLKISKRKY